MEKSNIPEEVTITPVIRDIERLVLRLFSVVKIIIQAVIRAIVKFIKHFAKYFLVLVVATFIGGLLGFFSDEVFPRGYSTNMIVEPTLGTNVQLQNDVVFVNSLIENSEYGKISTLFGITISQAETLLAMKVVSVSTEIDRLRYVNEFYKSLDTALKSKYDVPTALKEGDDFFAKKFAIIISGSEPLIFGTLEPRFIAFLERIPSLQQKRKAAIILLTKQRQYYEAQISDLDTLKKVSNIKMLQSANNSAGSGTTISLGNEPHDSKSSVLDVYGSSNEFFNKVVSVEAKLLDLKSCYKIYAHFSEYGSITGFGRLSRAGILAGSFFLIALLLTGVASLRSYTGKLNA
ncbi:MAG: hypothetical protein ACJARP_002089 [Vicingaceae bacterium]|jgi:hypothetical protein